MDVACSACSHVSVFEQPYPYHAGHADQGFLYNAAGNCTLVWSSFDPAYVALVGEMHPWTLGPESWARLEAKLRPAPFGGRWGATNPPRCLHCSASLEAPIGEGAIHYVVYPGSVLLDEPPGANRFAEVLDATVGAT